MKILFREANLFIFVETKIILMKKLMIPAVAVAMFMASCGGVKSDAEKICDVIKESIEIEKSGDKAKIEEFSKKAEADMKEMQAKYPKGSAEEKELQELVKPCMEEAMKAAMGGN